MPENRHRGQPKPIEERGGPEADLNTENPHLVFTLQRPEDLPEDDTQASKAIIKRFGSAWTALAKKYGDLRLSRLVPRLECAWLDEIPEEVNEDGLGPEPYRLTDFFRIDPPAAGSAEKLLKDVHDLPGVRFAYVDPPRVPCLVQPGNDPEYASQGYTQRAPEGIGIDAIWPRGTQWRQQDRFAVLGIPGSDGAGQELMDVENGFYAEHPDLQAHFLSTGSNPAQPIIGVTIPSKAGHGTGVLGIICAVDNQLGCCGIVPHLSVVRMASLAGTGGLSCCGVLCKAMRQMSPGAVLLIVVEHGPGSPASALPLEVRWPEWLVLRKGRRAGIVVVEAAGNGGKDFAAIPWAAQPELVNPAVHDSGAILVGAATKAHPHTRVSTSNYGIRVNCYAWGEGVATLSADYSASSSSAVTYQPGYRTDFSKTSAAAAIIAGAALSVQGMVSARFGRRLSPRQMRNVLADPFLGTASSDPQIDEIGVMPDLERVVARLGIVEPSPWWFGAP